MFMLSVLSFFHFSSLPLFFLPPPSLKLPVSFFQIQTRATVHAQRAGEGWGGSNWSHQVWEDFSEEVTVRLGLVEMGQGFHRGKILGCGLQV